MVCFLQIIYVPIPVSECLLGARCWARGEEAHLPATGSSGSGVQLGDLQTVYSLSYTLLQRAVGAGGVVV